jgi:hypothetical protein
MGYTTGICVYVCVDTVWDYDKQKERHPWSVRVIYATTFGTGGCPYTICLKPGPYVPPGVPRA